MGVQAEHAHACDVYVRVCACMCVYDMYIATVTGRPLHEAPKDTVGGRDWTDFTMHARAALDAWSVARVCTCSSTV